jgi:hypothetical protein
MHTLTDCVVLKGVPASRVNHNPSKTDECPPTIHKMNVRIRIVNFGKRPLDGLWLKGVPASRVKGCARQCGDQKNCAMSQPPTRV